MKISSVVAATSLTALVTVSAVLFAQPKPTPAPPPVPVVPGASAVRAAGTAPVVEVVFSGRELREVSTQIMYNGSISNQGMRIIGKGTVSVSNSAPYARDSLELVYSTQFPAYGPQSCLVVAQMALQSGRSLAVRGGTAYLGSPERIELTSASTNVSCVVR